MSEIASELFRLTRITTLSFATEEVQANLESSLTRCAQIMRAGCWTPGIYRIYGTDVYTVYTRIYRIYSYRDLNCTFIQLFTIRLHKMNILFVNIDDDGVGAYDCYVERAMQREL